MGLGPPVCLRCRRTMAFHDDSKAWDEGRAWTCPRCGPDVIQSSLWTLDDTRAAEVAKNDAEDRTETENS